MGLVALVVACGIAAQSPIFVSFGVQPDCSAAAVADVRTGSGRSGEPLDRWAIEINAAARRFDVPPQWVRAVMQAESGGIPSATSQAGAMGLMQIMPATWIDLRSRYRLGADPYQPSDNITAGVAYLRELLDRYGAPDFLAAYNAGPGRLDAYLSIGRPLPDETQEYVTSIGPQLVRGTSFGEPLGVNWSGSGEIGDANQAAQRSIGGPAASAVFVQRMGSFAAAAMDSAGRIGATKMLDSRSREGLFVPLDGQGSIP
jgi:hypothetical protein